MYEIKIGKFDHKLGPIDITSLRKGYCQFSTRECNGFNCPIIVDAINSKEKNIFFEDGVGLFQNIKIGLKQDKMRGGIERYVIIIKINKGLGKIKEEILQQISDDFIQLFENHPLIQDREHMVQFTKKWEHQLSNNMGCTDNSEKMHDLREKLNIVSLNMQLLLRSAKNNISTEYYTHLEDILLDLFEMDNLLEEKS